MRSSLRPATTKVISGSVRYLMERDFNPKANDEVVVIGVTLPAHGKVLKLRDGDGRPVWMKERYGGPMRKPSK